MKLNESKAKCFWSSVTGLIGLCVAFSAGLAFAATEEIGDVTWSYTVADSQATVIGVDPATGDLEVPSELAGLPVTGIGDYAFDRCSELTSVSIPSSVALIGNAAFARCSKLTSISVDRANSSYCSVNGCLYSADLKTLIQYPCGSVGSYDIPYGVVCIGMNAFYGCAGLTSVTVPASVKSIGGGAFCQCQGLTSISIPSSVINIGDAFKGCTGLGGGVVIVDGCLLTVNADCPTDVYIPQGVRIIADGAFENCDGLSSVTIPSSVKNIGEHVFKDCGELRSVTISSGVTNIGERAFRECRKLTSLEIPSSVISIGLEAFDGCVALGSGVVVVDDCVLAVNGDCPNFVELPFGVRIIASGAFAECNGLRSVIIPPSVSDIGDYAFAGCSALTTIVLSDGVTSIGDKAFVACCGLKCVVIPASVKVVGDMAFAKCKEMTSLTIADGVESIGNEAFEGCGELLSVDIPSSVMSIGAMAFANCSNMISLVMSEGMESIGRMAFANCTKLNSATIPSSVSSIDDYVFWNCIGLMNVTISSGVTSIGDGMFDNCHRLTVVTIPPSVTNIGEFAFGGCDRLTCVRILSARTTVCNCAFAPNARVLEATLPGWDCGMNVTAITNLVISEDTEIIREMAFAECSRLLSVTIPSSVVSIGEGAFFSCDGLTNVTLACGVTTIGDCAFNNCSSLAFVTIPASVNDIGEDAFYGCDALEQVDFEGAPPEGLVLAGIAVDAAVRYNYQYEAEWLQAIERCGFINATAYYPDCGPYTESVGGVEWTFFYRNGCAEIGTGIFRQPAVANLVDMDVVVPEELGGCPVVSLSDCAFYEMPITSVAIPTSVTNIGYAVFYGCEAISKVEIPSSVCCIGRDAFNGCSALGEVRLSEGLDRICNGAFADCTALTDVVVPDSVKRLGHWVNVGTNRLVREVKENVKVTENGGVTFCDAESVTAAFDGSIGKGAFDGCVCLTNIHLSAGLEYLGACTFRRCKALTSVVVPDGVHAIGAGCFAECLGLESVTLPRDLEILGSVKGEVYGSLSGDEDDAESYKYYTETIDTVMVTDDEGVVYKDAIAVTQTSSVPWCEKITDEEMRDTDIKLAVSQTFEPEDGVFYLCRNLKEVTIPASVRRIAGYTFAGCDNLKWVVYEGDEPALVAKSIYKTAPAKLQSVVSDTAFGWVDEYTSKLPNLWRYRSIWCEKKEISEYEVSAIIYDYTDDDGVSAGLLEDTYAYLKLYREMGMDLTDDETEELLEDIVTACGMYPGELEYADDCLLAIKEIHGMSEDCLVNVVENLLAVVESHPGALGWYAELLDHVGDDLTELLKKNIASRMVDLIYVYPWCLGKAVKCICSVSESLGISDRKRIINDVTEVVSCAEVNADAFSDLIVNCGSEQTAAVRRNLIMECLELLRAGRMSADKFGAVYSAIGSELSTWTEEAIAEAVREIARENAGRGTTGGVPIVCDNAEYIVVTNTFSIADSAFERYYKLRKIEIADGVRDIGNSAFRECVSLQRIVIPDSVTNIGHFAFRDCTGLREVVIKGGTTVIADDAFAGVSKSAVVTVDGKPYGASDALASGFVVVITEVKGGSAFSIPSEWMVEYRDFVRCYGDDATAAMQMKSGKHAADGSPMLVWQDYVAGTDPTDVEDVFKASVTMVEGVPVISWTPELPAAEAAKRVYKTFGKKQLQDAEWTDVSDIGGEERKGYNFFRVTVEMR